MALTGRLASRRRTLLPALGAMWDARRDFALHLFEPLRHTLEGRLAVGALRAAIGRGDHQAAGTMHEASK